MDRAKEKAPVMLAYAGGPQRAQDIEGRLVPFKFSKFSVRPPFLAKVCGDTDRTPSCAAS